MELVLIFKLLKKNIRYLLIIPTMAGIAAFIFTLYSPKSYYSTAKIATNFTTDRQIKLTDEKSNLWDSGVKFNNLIATMSGELFLSLLSYNLIIHDLTEDKPFRSIKINNSFIAGKSKEELDTIVGYFEYKLNKMENLSLYNNYERKLDSLIHNYNYDPESLGKALSIGRDGGTDFVVVSFKSENPYLSAFAVNTLCKEYIRYDNNRTVNHAERSVVFFSNLVKEKKKILDEKKAAVNSYKSTYGLYNDNQEELNATQISALEANRINQRNKIQRLEISLTNINSQLAAIQIKESDSSNLTNVKILELRDRINSLNTLYINGGSKDQELENKIALLRQLLRKEMEKLPNSTSKSYQSKDELIASKNKILLDLEIENANLRTLDNSISSLRSQASSSERNEASLTSLELEVETASKEYLQAVEKYNMEKNKALISESPIQIIQMGQPNFKPNMLKNILIIGLAIIASLSLSIFTILVIEFADMRIKTPSKFKTYTGLNLLGSINLIATKKNDLKSLLEGNVQNKVTDRNKHLLRKIRYEIVHSNAQVILFTSTKIGEGKTFLLLSISHSLSLLNKKILIVDTNFKNNSLTKLLLNKHAISGLLLEKNGKNPKRNGQNDQNGQNGQNDQNIISATAIGNVDIIGNKGEYDSPSEIFATIDFESFIERMKSSYDYIFMEGPSLNEFSDTKELAIYAEKVLPVFSAYSTIKSTDRESIEYLKNLDGKLMDSILNMTDSKIQD